MCTSTQQQINSQHEEYTSYLLCYQVDIFIWMAHSTTLRTVEIQSNVVLFNNSELEDT